MKKRAAPPVKKPAATKKAKVERVVSGERRTSGRRRSEVKYKEAGDSTDDEKMDIEDEKVDIEDQAMSDAQSTEPED